MTELLAKLQSAQDALTTALNYPQILKVEEYADLTVSLDLIRNIRSRVEKSI